MRAGQKGRVAALAVLLGLLAACGGGGGSGGSTGSGGGGTVATPPGAPSLSAITPGNGSATATFAAPASSGTSPITGYSLVCTANGTPYGTTGAGSPMTLIGLTNGTTYDCVVRATSSVGTGAASNSLAVTPAAGSGSTGGGTSGILCAYSYSALNSSASVNLTSTANWTCNASNRVLAANGVPDHAVGTFPNAGNPNTITSQNVSASYTLTPAVISSSGTPTMVVGHALNGVKFDPGTGGTCDNTGSNCSLIGGNGAWRIEALGQSSFNFGVDSNNAHVQPDGAYHYHGMPEGFVTKLGRGTQMALVGWAADGFPVYARYGYVNANDATSGTKVLRGSWQLKSTPDSGRPSTGTYPMGTFAQDYSYVAGSGDLDQCNGRTGVTPEFPNGIYHYVITDTYPYIGRCLKGR